MSPADRERASQDRGERKLVTTLFADLTGFTALSEELDPEEVRELVNACFDVLVPVVEGCGGTVDKFIGDEVMALFGAPTAHEDDTVRCLTAALGMMERFGAFAAASGRDLGMHIGVETGMVVSGGVGSRGREEYSVIGDAVNLSARLADASEAGQILVGPAARRLAGEDFRFRALPPFALKGKTEPVPVFLLEGKVPGASRAARARVASRLVGRADEVERMSAVLEALRGGSGGVITISGEPGLGKSRLVAEIREATPEGITWAEGAGRSFGRSAAYAVAAGVLDDLAGVAPDAPAAEVEAALRAAVRSALPETGAADATYPYLAWLHGLPLTPGEDERVRHLAPEALRDRLRDAFTGFVRAASLEQPLVLVWEDLHWADASSLTLAEALLPLTAELPLVCLFVYRPHEGGIDLWRDRVAAEVTQGVCDVTLAPLGARESGDLVDGLLPAADFPDAARDLILERAEGNPFFLEELLRALLDAGLIVVRDGVVVVTEGAAEATLPGTLHGVAAARIDALAAADKENLQSASVIGRAFQRQVLAGVARRTTAEEGARPATSLDESLGELCRRELVRERSETDFVFKHAVTREVAYGGLLKARRRTLHRSAAEVIEELFPDRLEELSATLGRHWLAAGAPDRALEYLRAAAERARRSFSSAEALELYAAALEAAADDSAKRAAIEEDVGDVLALAGRFEEARAHLRSALASQTAALDRARLLRKTAATLVFDQPGEAAGVFEQAEAELGPAPSGDALAWWHESIEMHGARLRYAYWIHDTQVMNDWATWATATLERPEAQAERGTLMRMLVTQELGMSRYHPAARALEWTADCVELAVRNDDLAEVAEAYFLHAFVLMWRDEVEEAMAWFARTIAVCRRIGDATDELRGLVYLAVLHRRRGEVDEVVGLVDEAQGLLASTGLDAYISITHGNRAWVAWRRGDLDAARTEGEASREVLTRLPHMPLSWIALWPLLAVRLEDGDLGAGVELARVLVDPAQMKLPDDLEAPLAQAVSAWGAGDEGETLGALQSAVRRAEESRWGWL
jgi:class 3 adenylate cyclase/tetratricopeptide (TPR) repeat protein